MRNALLGTGVIALVIGASGCAGLQLPRIAAPGSFRVLSSACSRATPFSGARSLQRYRAPIAAAQSRYGLNYGYGQPTSGGWKGLSSGECY
ncbi:MAG TPA: hypothetical protein VFE05_22930 [Longimicrobiaceae bacterium]|jgi:hypothetical protein|nr:hypothetical protein [Longimicrobiaceae bacterium]